MVGHLGHVDVEVVRHEAQDGEDDEAGVHAGRTVGDADDDAVSVAAATGGEVVEGEGERKGGGLLGGHGITIPGGF